MPIYPYRCKNNHEFDVFLQISEYSPERKCEKCSLMASRIFTPSNVNGCMISDKTREMLVVPFGRKRAESFREVRDIDRSLSEFKQKYGAHVGEPGRNGKDE